MGLSMNAVGIYRDNQLFFDREIQVARANDMTVQMHYLEDYANRELEQGSMVENCAGKGRR